MVEVLFVNAPDIGKSTAMVSAGTMADSDELNDSGEAMITVMVKDKNGNPVEGANVDFELVNADSKIKFSNGRQRVLGDSRPHG